MKASKWLKWKVGAVFTISIALIFQFVKTSPQFELETAKANPAATNNSDSIQSNDDPVIQEWFNSQQDDADSPRSRQHSGSGRHFIRSGGQQDDRGSSNFNDSTGGGRSDTRTSQS